MRILHTSDWHLGKKLDNYSRLEEQKNVLSEICDIAKQKQVDAVLIAGDIFDTFNPPIEAVDLFYKTVKTLSDNGKRAVIAIAGNHDSPDRIQAPDPLARECGILMLGYPVTSVRPYRTERGISVMRSEPGFVEIQLPGQIFPLRLFHTAYANEQRLKKALLSGDSESEMRELLADHWNSLADKYADSSGVNIMATHLFVINRGQTDITEPEDEKPILHVGGAQAVYTSNIPESFQYVALGHLHRKIELQQHIVYSGSPVAYSMSESDQSKYVVVVDVNPGEKMTKDFVELTEGRGLQRASFESVEEAIEWLNVHQESYVELTLKLDTYLTAEQRKTLYDTHERIVALIPELSSTTEITSGASIDLNKDMQELFVDYFTSMNKQEPSEDIIDLFKEVCAEEEVA